MVSVSTDAAYFHMVKYKLDKNMSEYDEESELSVDYAQLYDDHGEYAARRIDGSHAQTQVLLEAKEFKIPNLVSLFPDEFIARNVLEIGSATGELIAHFPTMRGGRRVGCDISAKNVEAAKRRYPLVEFFADDFRQLEPGSFDVVILSDILEHVEEDAEFLEDASRLAKFSLVNLPLEDNFLNKNRAYGPSDSSGHLRKYSYKQGIELFDRSGLRVINHRRVWVHETGVDLKRRQVRAKYLGNEYSGSAMQQLIKPIILGAFKSISPLGRKMFASNLFAFAVRGGVAD